MNIAEIVVVFVISWWLVLLAALPIGVRRDETPESGNDHGAPVKTLIGRKIIYVTITGVVFTACFYWLTTKSGISLREIFTG